MRSLIVLFSLVIIPAANAGITTFTYRGTIVEVPGQLVGIAPFEVGKTVLFSTTFDTDAAPLTSSDTFAAYPQFTATLTLTDGTLLAESFGGVIDVFDDERQAVFGDGFRAFVTNDPNFSGFPGANPGAVTGPVFNRVSAFALRFALVDSTKTAFSSTALPTQAPDPLDFNPYGGIIDRGSQLILTLTDPRLNPDIAEVTA